MTDTFRRVYTPLSEDQKLKVKTIKVEADVLLDILNNAISPNERSERARCMNIARTKLEECVMWATKGISTDVYE
jgi:hypothetical protein